MYGLPKIHKETTPLRPILAAYNTPTYPLAKFLIPILQPLTVNDYTLQNSYDFYNKISTFTFNGPMFMSSFDITSLFTNIPLDETINLICQNLFSTHDRFHNFSEIEFREFLNLTCRESFFIFGDSAYQQRDGVQMGSPLGPTLANAFLCHYETIWLNLCPPEFKPIFYKRYIDDTFIIFKEQSHATKFLEFLNNQHVNIKFTLETEHNKSIPFLDIKTFRDHNNKMHTSIYRKPTFSGLGMSFFSHTPLKYKINNIKTLIYRAYNLSSSLFAFHQEIEFLRIFFTNNGYPISTVEKQCRNFLNNIYKKPAQSLTVNKKIVFLSLPYYGTDSEPLYSKLLNILSDYYPQVKFNIALKNTFTIGSLFRSKDSVSSEVLADIIYCFTCDSCQASYVGSTKRRFRERVDQHLGVSSRTGKPLTTVTLSIPRKHATDHNHPFKSKHFKIIDQSNSSLNLLILESLHIHQLKLSLNIQQFATNFTQSLAANHNTV